MTTKEMIEYKDNDEWIPVKPQPKYRPYKNAGEFLAAQREHGIWLKSIKKDAIGFISTSTIKTFLLMLSQHLMNTMTNIV